MTLATRTLLLMGYIAFPVATEAQLPPVTAARGELDAGLKKELESLAEKLETIRDLAADFEEQKFSALLKKPLVSKGRMRVVGARSRWETISPKPSSMSVDPAEIRIYFPERSTMEVYPVDEKLRWLTIWPLPKLSVLVDRFFIERTPVAELGEVDRGVTRLGLRLSPRDEALEQYLRRVDVVLNHATALVVRVEILDADGDRTVISFSNARPNSGLNEKDVELVVPPGTQTVRPLAKLEKEPPNVHP